MAEYIKLVEIYGPIATYINAKITDEGRLVVFEQLFVPANEELFGYTNYKRWLTIRPAIKPVLLNALLEDLFSGDTIKIKTYKKESEGVNNDSIILDILKKLYSDYPKSRWDLKGLLDSKKIQYEFSNNL